ncbi:hypothetical protein Tco_0378987 [Tanacetum coccineum]
MMEYSSLALDELKLGSLENKLMIKRSKDINKICGLFLIRKNECKGESDVDEVGDLGMYSIEDEDVSLIDGVLEGALGVLGFGNGSSSGCHGC